MANVLLTTRCNLKCPYCFAQERLDREQKLNMALSDAVRVIDFLKRSNHMVLRLMGGEPTLHPQFAQILEMALQSGMRVDLLSNATWPAHCNALFQRVSPRLLVFLLNVDHPSRYQPALWARIEENLQAIRGRGSITLSFNLFEKTPQSDYIFDLARRFEIDKIRMSFSLPVLGANNRCLPLEDYKGLAPFIVDFVRQAEAEKMQVRLDNAVPLCMFDEAQAGALLLKGVLDLQRNMYCDPVIDIGPDLRLWCCFCLSRLWNRHLGEFENLEEIYTFFQRELRMIQGHLYPLPECQECSHRSQWKCQGGCLTHTIQRHEELFTQPCSPCRQDEFPLPDHSLSLAPEVQVRHYDLPEKVTSLYNKNTGVEMEIDASLLALFEHLDGLHSSAGIVNAYLRSTVGEGSGSLHEMLTDTARKGARELLSNLIAEKFVAVSAPQPSGE
jgi:hypothetical protein